MSPRSALLDSVAAGVGGSTPETRPTVPNSLDWVIVGGGIHGVHLAVRLLVEGRVAPDRLVIVDPAPTLLHRWHTCTGNTGMSHLRSPGVHHLDVDPWSLFRFAEQRVRARKPRHLFAPPYDRPAVGLFAEHCRALIARHQLDARVVRGRVTSVTPHADGVEVTLEDGSHLSTKRLILALGASDQPHWPGWALPLRADGAPIEHVYTPGYELRPRDLPERVAVVGAGITGAQVALRLAKAGHRVALWSRHALREHQFDSDPGWIGPKHMRRFEAESSHAVRRRLILEARHRGSLPKDVHRDLRAAFRSGAIEWNLSEVRAASWSRADGVRLDATQVGAVVLATGFERRRPGGALVDHLVEAHALPCAACGFPVVDRALRWHPRIHVSGPLAELELGPTARNIAGARRAGERIVTQAVR